MKSLPKILNRLGIVCVVIGIAIVILTFLPIILQEINYDTQTHTKTVASQIIPLDTSFGIVIPKLKANARIIPNVDPYNPAIYQRALTQGVAHAKGSSSPGQPGNVFLFAHSSVDFFEATKFNSVFYLIDKLEKGDEIRIYYKETLYNYLVTDKKIVSSKEISYLSPNITEQTLTLMTCWPPGTTYKRLLVIGTLSSE